MPPDDLHGLNVYSFNLYKQILRHTYVPRTTLRGIIGAVN